MVELLSGMCKALYFILSTTERKKNVYACMCICVFHVCGYMCVREGVCRRGKVDARNLFVIAFQPYSWRQGLSIISGFTHTAGLAAILLWRILSLSSKVESLVGLVLWLVSQVLEPLAYLSPQA